jgi:hypothetical protein
MIGNRPFVLLGRCCTGILRHKLHAATQRSTTLGCARLFVVVETCNLGIAMGKEE